MKKINTVFLTSLLSSSFYYQAQVVDWQKHYKSNTSDAPGAIIRPQKGGYLVAANAQNVSGMPINGHHGSIDCQLTRIDEAGEIVWQKYYGGQGVDWVEALVETDEGGFIFVANTSSSEGDITGTRHSPAYLFDIWLVKISDQGIIEWQKCLGGSSDDMAYSLIKTANGGYLLAGYTASTPENITSANNNEDAWLIKFNAAGQTEWQYKYGGNDTDGATSITEVDDGYIVGGFSHSNSSSASRQFSNSNTSDGWVFKINASGELLWQKYFGGPGSDAVLSITTTADKSILFTGYTTLDSKEEKSGSGNVIKKSLADSGNTNCWVVKLSSHGDLLWQKSASTRQTEIGTSVIETSDQNIFVAYTSALSGRTDIYQACVMQLHSDGTFQNKNTGFGYIKQENSSNLELIAGKNNTYILCGGGISEYGNSMGNTDTTFSERNTNLWICGLHETTIETKLDQNSPSAQDFKIYPIPATDNLTITSDQEFAFHLINSEGYIILSGQSVANTANIVTSEIKPGLYILNITGIIHRKMKMIIAH